MCTQHVDVDTVQSTNLVLTELSGLHGGSTLDERLVLDGLRLHAFHLLPDLLDRGAGLLLPALLVDGSLDGHGLLLDVLLHLSLDGGFVAELLSHLALDRALHLALKEMLANLVLDELLDRSLVDFLSHLAKHRASHLVLERVLAFVDLVHVPLVLHVLLNRGADGFIPELLALNGACHLVLEQILAPLLLHILLDMALQWSLSHKLLGQHRAHHLVLKQILAPLLLHILLLHRTDLLMKLLDRGLPLGGSLKRGLTNRSLPLAGGLQRGLKRSLVDGLRGSLMDHLCGSLMGRLERLLLVEPASLGRSSEKTNGGSGDHS